MDMKIGIGLPNPVPGVDGRVLVEWARRAEAGGFSTLATIDRLAYPSYESMAVLAAAAGATERIGLLTNILLAATRNPVVLAKEAASVYHLSNGRFTLGVGVGGRADDFDVAKVPFEERGRRMDRMLDLMRRAWRGEAIEGCESAVNPGPVLERGVPLLIGGTSDRAFQRAVEYGIGWTAGGGSPDQVRDSVTRIKEAWKDAGREGDPHIVALSYYSLGQGTEDASRRYLLDYYRFLGPHIAGMIADNVPRTREAVKETAAAFEDAGFDELVFDPTVAHLDQVDLLATAV
jgi:alkanesulfonate monooxygenase SsuD/methylene tetrahydromethanopterin reductase-like flavin-dependent oxidoreductase (luciferase family)